MPSRALIEFDRLSEYISVALEHAGGTHTVEDVRNLVADARLQLWPGSRSVVLTNIIDAPRKRVLLLYLAAGAPGALPELRRMLPQIEAWGREQGCTLALAYGRRGWARLLTGWTQPNVEFRKEL